MSEVVPVHRFRSQIPQEHRASIDTRIAWLWNQRFGTVQMVWKDSKDLLDKTAATLILQAVFGEDLDAIQQIFTRIEGGAIYDTAMEDKTDPVIRI